MAEAHALVGVRPVALGVGPAMDQGGRHRLHLVPERRRSIGPLAGRTARSRRTLARLSDRTGSNRSPSAADFRAPRIDHHEIIGGGRTGVKEGDAVHRSDQDRSPVLVVEVHRLWQPAACLHARRHDRRQRPRSDGFLRLPPRAFGARCSTGWVGTHPGRSDSTSPPLPSARARSPAHPTSSASAPRRPAPPGGTSSCSPTRDRHPIRTSTRSGTSSTASGHGRWARSDIGAVLRLVPPAERFDDRRMDSRLPGLPLGTPLLNRPPRTPGCSVLLRDPVERFRSGLGHLDRRWVRPATAPPSPTPCSVGSTSGPSTAGWTTSIPGPVPDPPTRAVRDRPGPPAGADLRTSGPEHASAACPPTGQARNSDESTARSFPADVIRHLVELYEADVAELAAWLPEFDLGLVAQLRLLGRRRARRLGGWIELPHRPAVATVLAHPTQGPVPQALDDGRPFGAAAQPSAAGGPSRPGARRTSWAGRADGPGRTSCGRGSRPARPPPRRSGRCSADAPAPVPDWSAGTPPGGQRASSTSTSNPASRTRQKKSKSSRPKNQSGSGSTPASTTGRDTSVAPQQATSTGVSSPGDPSGGTTLSVWVPRPTNFRP